MFAAYERNRPAPPADLIPQFPYFRRVLEGLEIALLELAGYEADDVKPAKVIEVMELMGDAVDNIPGVKRIGEKTFIGLIRRFGTLENLFSRLDKIEHLERRRAAAKNAGGWQRSGISQPGSGHARRNAPINISLEPLKFTGFDEEKLHCLFAELEFNILVNCWKMGGFDSIPRRACARKSASLTGFFLSNFLLDLTLHLWQIERRKRGGTDCLKGRQVEAARC